MVIRNKTAPSVLNDFATHDPNSHKTNQTCQHQYVTQYERSQLPELDERPSETTRWKASSICKLCRCNLEVNIHFLRASRPCPNQDNPLHHFRYHGTQGRGYLHLSCTANDCQADLYARIRPAFLTPGEVFYLTDRRAIQTRFEGIIQDGRTIREGEATTYECLRVLRTYINDALNNQEVKRIDESQKKFMLAIGNHGRELLNRLGFSHQAPDGPDRRKFWYLPQDVQSAEDQSVLEALERAKDEIGILMLQTPEGRGDDPSVLKQQANGIRDFERVMGTLDYDRKLWPRRVELSSALINSYDILGALPDFSAELMCWSYDRQVACDPSSASTYYEHFKEIASSTNDEVLETKAMLLESQGQVSARDVKDAYNCIGIQPEHTDVLDDKVVLDQYRSRLSDVSQNEQRRMKEALRVIALSRGSQLIMNAASDTIANYDQALEYLGADRATPDDFIIALKVSKIEENKSNEEHVRKAIEIIANERNSSHLRRDLAGDAAVGSHMSIQEAYVYLGVVDPKETTDQQILDAYSLAILDAHEQPRREQLREAVDVIARERDSIGLNMALRDETVSIAPVPTAPITEPRGLRNIGNTCYLNSLLQYLFTVRPVREIVMDYEGWQQEITQGRSFSKKVGDSQINKHQVRRSQEWISELNKLFNELVKSRSTFITPEVNLARLTLSRVLDSESVKAATARRRSTITGPDTPVIRSPSSPLLQHRSSRSGTINENVQLLGSPKPSSPGLERRFSAASTVVEAEPESEYIQPNKKIEKVESIPEVSEEPAQLTEEVSSSPMDTDERNHNSSMERLIEPPDSADADLKQTTLEVPDIQREPPPVPPRPQKNNDDPSKKDQTDYEEYAQQQDVADVIEQVLFQLRFAIKAEDHDTNGEQIDAISRLFFGAETYTHVTAEGDKRGATEPFQALYLYPSEDCNIYDAIDSSFDKAETDDHVVRYKTLTTIPPILQLSLNRVGFDRETQRSFKIESQVKLSEEIFMDRYMEDEEMLLRRKESWIWKDRLYALRAKYSQLASTDLPDSNLPSVLDNTKAYLAELQSNAKELGLDENLIDSSLLDALEDTSSKVRHEMSALYAQIKGLETELANLFTDYAKLRYRLHAVFTHRGSSTGGHWFIYLYDATEKVWRWYNDENVQRMNDLKPILEPNSGIDGTSSLVVYVQERQEGQLIDTVYRDPEPYVPPPPPYPGFKAPYS